MPVLVRAFLSETRGVLYARPCIAPVSKLPAMGAEVIAQQTLLGRKVLRCFRLTHAKLRYSLAGACLSHTSRLLNGCLKVFA